jgi:hypothetical protein|tara:strand:+ start:2173 stop:2454 length:282 start_codon:yes stop_codon:yes gene_type:complete
MWEDIIKKLGDYEDAVDNTTVLPRDEVSDVLVEDVGKDIENLIVKKYFQSDTLLEEISRLKEMGFKGFAQSLVVYYAIQRYIRDKILKDHPNI